MLLRGIPYLGGRTVRHPRSDPCLRPPPKNRACPGEAPLSFHRNRWRSRFLLWRRRGRGSRDRRVRCGCWGRRDRRGRRAGCLFGNRWWRRGRRDRPRRRRAYRQRRARRQRRDTGARRGRRSFHSRCTEGRLRSPAALVIMPGTIGRGGGVKLAAVGGRVARAKRRGQCQHRHRTKGREEVHPATAPESGTLVNVPAKEI